MIIARTPLRISFLGGGTDYPDHFRRHEGRTLAVAIDRYSYVTVNRLADLFDHSIRVSYSETELTSTVDEINHPSVRECLRFLGFKGNVEVVAVSDLPARTGLGSSSSFTVSLLHALHALRGEYCSQEQLAAEAVHVEQDLIGERVGVQDQYTCAVGGLVQVRCGQDGVRAEPVVLPEGRLTELQDHLLLFYTGVRRHAHEILEEQLEHTKAGTLDAQLARLTSLVEEGIAVLTTSSTIEGFGAILHESWMLKRDLSSRISTPAVDEAYETARRCGALGGKLLGAGGGGFLLFFASPESHDAIRRSLTPLREIEVGFDRVGSAIAYYRP